jgi:hypothetical protein
MRAAVAAPRVTSHLLDRDRGSLPLLGRDTCAMLIVCRSSWTATSSSGSQPRKPHLRISRTSRSRAGTVRFLTYWFDEQRQTAFCLAAAPSADAVEEVHRASHGYMAYQIIEVDESMVARFMGGILEHPPREVYVEAAFRMGT